MMGSMQHSCTLQCIHLEFHSVWLLHNRQRFTCLPVLNSCTLVAKFDKLMSQATKKRLDSEVTVSVPWLTALLPGAIRT
jgi:hypothetical protein